MRASLVDQVTFAAEQGDGFLRLKGRVIQAGILERSGKDIEGAGLDPARSYRLKLTTATLSDATTLRSLNEAPLMFADHFDANPENAGQIGGYPVGQARLDGDALRQDYKLTLPEAIKAYQDDSIKELSPGYSFKLTPSIDDAYDFDLTDLIFNHVSQVDRGKNGPEVRLFDKEGHVKPEELKALADALSESIKETVAKQVEAALKDRLPETPPKDKPAEKVETRTHYEDKLAETQAFNDDLNMVTAYLGDKAETRLADLPDEAKHTEAGSRYVLAAALDLGPDEVDNDSLEVMRAKLNERKASAKDRKPAPVWKGAPKTDNADFDPLATYRKNIIEQRKAAAA